MKKRYKPRQVRSFDWSPRLAYAVGLITTDGSLSCDERHITFTSQDIELIGNIKIIFNCGGKIGFTRNAKSEAYRINICDVQLYDWLLSIGLSPKKSLTVKDIKVPDQFFIDFLRGHLDGDGSITTYVDRYNTKVKAEYIYNRLWVRLISGSKQHVLWLQEKISDVLKVKGRFHITKPNHLGHSMYILKFAKKDSLELLKKIYYADDLPCLSRKKAKYTDFLKTL